VFTSAVGEVTLVAHPYQKQGRAFFVEPTTAIRVGASDITMRGANGESIMLELGTQAGTEIRALSHQCALLTVPGHSLDVYGIAPTGAATSGS
jgi:hypothetical protein